MSDPSAACLFCKIAAGTVPAPVVFEDETSLAFLDHRPVFPGHTLLIPKQHYETLADLPVSLIQPFFAAAQLLARAIESALAADGTFVAINNRVSQSVQHLHVHIVPRRKKDGLRGFFWPRQPYKTEDEADNIRKNIADTVLRLRAGAERSPMWPQNYTPVGGSLWLSTLVAAVPVFVLLVLLGFLRKPAWQASLYGLGAAAVVAYGVYGMHAVKLASAIGYGAAFGLFPIGWVVFTAILLYNITVSTGRFQIVKDSVGSLTEDRRLQALLIAFAFGAFIEGAAGFGTPVAVAAAMLTGLGFSPLFAGGICLLANTAPVAFGSIATPILALAGITGLPLDRLSAGVGRICAPVSLIVPAYLILVMGGWRALRGVLPAAAVCGFTFAGTQLLVSNLIGPQVTDILSSLAAIGALVLFLKFWKPRDKFQFDQHSTAHVVPPRHSGRDLLHAWGPYILLVIFVLAWGFKPLQSTLNSASFSFPWPGLNNAILRMPPVVNTPAPYPAVYTFNSLSAPGTACLFAAILSAIFLGMPPAQFLRVFLSTVKQLLFAELTIAAVLALAFLMNYSGATATLGLAFAATGVMFPFFSAMLGWLGVFLTGSDTASNALFGNLQVITAGKLGMNAVLMAASNSAGGVMGKMISLQSIAVASAATAMKTEDEGRLFRFTLRHSILLASITGLIVVFYTYVAPQWAP